MNRVKEYSVIKTESLILIPRLDDIAPDQDENPGNNHSDIIWALRDVSFEVRHGEAIGIIGRNGAGKSTLLKILSRITNPTRGKAKIQGRVSSLLEVGTGFHPELTGRENVYLNGTILGMTKKEVDRNFDRIVDFSGVEKFIDTPAKRYSVGMQVRLAFSVAAHLEPDILIIDEVLAVGDTAFQKKCMSKMQEVARRGRTVLFVSHNLNAINSLCNRALLIQNGRIVEDGCSDRVVKAYLDGDTSKLSELRWQDPAKAPAGDTCRLIAISVHDETGEVAESFNIDSPIGIKMEYYVLKSGSLLMPLFHVLNEEGIQVFAVHDTDPSWRRRPRPKGRYISTVWIPGNLLCDGRMFVKSGLITLNPDIKQFYIKDEIAFQVVDRGNINETARGGWSGSMKGVVRPLLNWTTEYFQI